MSPVVMPSACAIHARIWSVVTSGTGCGIGTMPRVDGDQAAVPSSNAAASSSANRIAESPGGIGLAIAVPMD